MANTLPLAGCRVLVMEDEYFIADELTRVLVARGAQVVGPIADLETALDQVRRDGFDVAVLDINLRGEMAYRVADELNRQGIPFVFATGYDQSAIPPRFADLRFWEKPFDERQLVDDLVRLSALAAAGREVPRPA